MRATNIRNKDGSKLQTHELEMLCKTILAKTARAGFITEANVLNGSSIKIGMHMSSFRIDTDQLGHNARAGRFVSSPKGYKRTNVPTWDQRVEFNDIVNDVFDRMKLKARIKSGCYTVRSKEGRRSENDWYNETPNSFAFSSDSDREIMTEQEARERCDSDRLEAEHEAKMKPIRLQKAKERRALIRAFESAPKVRVAGLYESQESAGFKNGMTLSHAVFARKLEKLNRWAVKQVREASIEATVESNRFGLLTLVPESTEQAVS